MIESFSIFFSWSPPAVPNGQIVSYTITYNLTGLPVSVNVSNGTQYLISGLEAYTFYQFTLTASTIVGDGPATMPLVLRTDIASKYHILINWTVLLRNILVTSACPYPITNSHATNLFLPNWILSGYSFIHLLTVPTAPPRNFLAFVTGTTSVEFSWQPPLIDDHNGLLSYYQLRIVDESFNLTDLSINTTNISHTITTLEEYVRYSCQVAAATDIGLGPFSSPVEITTLQDGESSFHFLFTVACIQHKE